MPIFKKDSTYWVVEGKKKAYAILLDENGYLQNPYWGEKLSDSKDYPDINKYEPPSSFDSELDLMPEEFPCPGKMKFVEPCLFLEFFDGTRDLDLQFYEEELSTDELIITLKDRVYPLTIKLHYRIFADVDVIEKWVELINEGEQEITFSRIFSGQIVMPESKNLHLTHLYGAWNHEFNREAVKLPVGKFVLESRRITSGHQHSPEVILHESSMSEYDGVGYFCAYGWSGNWKITTEKNSFGVVRMAVGLNDFDFEHILAGGDRFLTPPMYVGVTDNGFHDISTRMHHFVRSRLIPNRMIEKKVLYNSWEATEFDVRVEQQKKLANIAAKIGIELFVLDDGWFHGRNSDKAGLGDWWPDEVKFPNGLKPLADHVHNLGMDFGLWFEPEMVNPDSDLYRNHPDWILHFEHRKPTLGRNQMILDMSRQDVRDYLFEKISKVLYETGVDFIKWDMNRNVSEPGGKNSELRSYKEIWLRYTQGVYELWNRIQTAFPNIIFQTCSGGGGRSDFGMLKQADQVWVSDNTEPTERLYIQEGFSLFNPACVMESWVTEMGDKNLSLDYRFLVSMMGVLGLGADISKWREEEISTAKKWVEIYKKYRSIIQHGDQFRLISAYEDGYAAVGYVDTEKETAVVFVLRSFAPQTVKQPMLKPMGLDENSIYQLDDGIMQSGQAWHEKGIEYSLNENFSGKLFVLKKVNN